MSLQSIINISNSLNFDRRKVVGIQYARNELPRVSETPTFNPWKLTVGVGLQRYSDIRETLEELDDLDRTEPSVITFSDSPGLSWMLKYQGDLTTAQKNTVVVESFTGNQLVLNVSAVTTGPNSAVLKKGDFIQIYSGSVNNASYAFPFTSTSTVLRGSGSTVTVTTHRPNILTNSVVGLPLNWGNDVRFNVFCPNMPTYTLTPGGYKKVGNTVINNALVEFSNEFQLYEYVGAA